MTQSYADRYGVADNSAANLGIVINQGNAIRDKLEFVTRHEMSDGSFTEAPIDVTNLIFESGIVDGCGIVVAHFTLTKTATTSVVERGLESTITNTMAVGSYTYWIDTINAEGDRKTRMVGTIDIKPRDR